jgi:hypothetical protein
MKVMVGVQIKDGGIWLKRYLRNLELLQGSKLRVVCIYGESTDNTLSTLTLWQRQSQHQVEIYRDPYLPPEERFGFMLARPKREWQKLWQDEDYFFLCDPDIVQVPSDTLQKLVDADKDVVAPMVWIEGRHRKTFFDTYGYRKDGYRFHPFTPPGLDSSEPFTVDCVGSCYLATAEAMKKGVYTNPFPHLQFCSSLRDQGYEIWVDPRVNIYHVDLEKYGIYHMPPNIPLSQAHFIDSKFEPVPVGQVQLETKQQLIRDYDEWVRVNDWESHLWSEQFNNNRPLITASYKVLNEASYLPYSLESVYPHVDRIDIVEGAVRNSLHMANPDGSSQDSTVKLIRDFPDPEHKIRLVQGKWRNKEHMQRRLLELCESYWMMFIAGDELYLEQDLSEIRKFCASHLDGKIVYAIPHRTLNFWHDWYHITYSLNKQSPWGQNSSMHPLLIWRDVVGLNFNLFHTYPLDGTGRNLALDPYYENKRLVFNNVVLYHYGSAKPALDVYGKLLFQKKRGTGEVKGEAKDDMWFSGVMPEDFVIRPFKGDPPKVLESHPLRDQKLIKVTSKKPVYKFERIGE